MAASARACVRCHVASVHAVAGAVHRRAASCLYSVTARIRLCSAVARGAECRSSFSLASFCARSMMPHDSATASTPHRRSIVPAPGRPGWAAVPLRVQRGRGQGASDSWRVRREQWRGSPGRQGGSPGRALSSFETEMRSAAKGGRPIGRFLLTGALRSALCQQASWLAGMAAAGAAAAALPASLAPEHHDRERIRRVRGVRSSRSRRRGRVR
eukprot:SAG25_NODE_64_length_17680_cov_5.716398_18_plen_213_part_00